MRRMLAIVLLFALIAVIPAQAATGKIAVDQSAQEDALNAARRIHSLSVEPGETFSFLAAVPNADSEGACAVATALYLALRESGSVSMDELSYDAGNAGILVNADHDFRFTNHASGALRVAFEASGNALICRVDFDEAAAAESAARTPGPRKSGNAVSVHCGSDPALLSNVMLAANSVYDTTLAAGDVFSFNAIVGPTVEECGYQLAMDGAGNIVTGGGSDIVASALWLLIQERQDFAVVEKTTYGKSYNQTYVENSIDAILTDYASAADFSFRYTGKRSVTFYAMVEGETLSVVIE